MAPVAQISPSDFGDKARRELLQLLETASRFLILPWVRVLTGHFRSEARRIL